MSGLQCHGGSILGTSYLGLGNSTLDLQALFEDMNAESGKPGKLPHQVSDVRGTNEAFASGGGVTLAKFPTELTILDVVNAVEPIGRIRECPLGLTAHGPRLCPLHKRLDNAMAMVEEAFRKTTLAEILAEPTQSHPLCEFQ